MVEDWRGTPSAPVLRQNSIGGIACGFTSGALGGPAGITGIGVGIVARSEQEVEVICRGEMELPVIAPGDHLDRAACRGFRTMCDTTTTLGARSIPTRKTGRPRSSASLSAHCLVRSRRPTRAPALIRTPLLYRHPRNKYGVPGIPNYRPPRRPSGHSPRSRISRSHRVTSPGKR